MKISGFSMAKNADKLYYPIKEAIESVLPIVDEFVVAIGRGDEDDRTREIVASITSDKVKIVDTDWDIIKYPRGMEHAHQTDIAKEHCSGDWLLYLQADEVVHEKYLKTISEACQTYVNDKEVEGFLFAYKHFWGDYEHYHKSHGWYPFEIRIIRNDPDIHSWKSAQSFRRIPNFDGLNYRQTQNTYKLKVVKIDAEIYHYGWVRPPHFMYRKNKVLATNHKGKDTANQMFKEETIPFDYGPLNRLEKFKGTHPSVMKDWIARFDWKDQLQYSGKLNTRNRKPAKHERFKNRMFSFLKHKVLHMPMLGELNNYILLKK